MIFFSCRYQRDEARFVQDYPEAYRGIDPLVKAIRKQHGRQRNSRNGTPEERELRSSRNGTPTE